MPLHFVDIPDDAANLTTWLERHLVDSTLGELVAELSAAHPAGPPQSETLETLLGAKLKSVLSRGLSSLSESELRQLVGHPWLLMELQERIFIDGGDYWSTSNSTADEDHAIARVWSRVSEQIAHETPLTIARSENAIESTTKKSRRSAWIGTMALAVAAFVGGLRLRDQLLNPPNQVIAAQTSCGWIESIARAQNETRQPYFKILIDGAESWKKVNNNSPAQLATSINQFRQGCSVLLLSEHKPLPDSDKQWLRERCHDWADKLDRLLTRLENREEDFQVLRAAADEINQKLLEALRNQAQLTA